MKKTGIYLIILGGGSFLLPLTGLQFRVLMLFGNAAPIIGTILLVIGILLIVLGAKSEKKEVQNAMGTSGSLNPGSSTGRKCYTCKADISGTDTVCPKCKAPL